MNYFEIINKCLIELNYKQVSAFSELTKNDHKKLKNIINVINTEICKSEKWNFLQRKMQITLPANQCELENTIPGRIEAIICNGQKFEYYNNFEKFFVNSQPSNTYSLYDDKILLPLFNQNKVLEILYYTNNCAINSQGIEKFSLSESADKSLIPDAFAEPLLVYGGCMRLKGNPQHVRFNYWLSMYRDALANLHSKSSQSSDDSPNVKMFRK